MSLLSEQMREAYAANGVTTSFPFPWDIYDATDLDVYLVDELGTVLGTPGAEFFQTFVTAYDVIGKYNPLTSQNDDFSSGASVVFVSAPATGYTVVILRNTPDTQDLSLPQNTSYNPPNIELQFDKLVMMIQYLFDRVNRSIRMTDANPQTFNTALPNPIVADSTLAIDPTGTKIVMGPTVSFLTGANNIPELTFTIVNNQVSPANVIGLSFAGGKVRSAEIDAHFYINTTGAGATEMCARAKYFATYSTVAATWDLTPLGVSGDVDASGNPAGVALTITSSGQVQYTSGNTSGTPASSIMHFKASTMGV